MCRSIPGIGLTVGPAISVTPPGIQITVQITMSAHFGGISTDRMEKSGNYSPKSGQRTAASSFKSRVLTSTGPSIQSIEASRRRVIPEGKLKSVSGRTHDPESPGSACSLQGRGFVPPQEEVGGRPVVPHIIE
jgi:hypothetical protein